jgi:hypothetical protein
VRIQRIQFLEKYAARAEDFLSQKFGNDYTAKDVEKVAEALINADLERAAEIERVEDLVKQARYIAKGFTEEINSNFGDGSFQKLASTALLNSLKNVLKGASKSDLGQKIMGSLNRAGIKTYEFAKRDPLQAAGIAAGSGVTALAGTALMDSD